MMVSNKKLESDYEVERDFYIKDLARLEGIIKELERQVEERNSQLKTLDSLHKPAKKSKPKSFSKNK